MLPILRPEDVSDQSPLHLSLSASFIVGKPQPDGKVIICSQHVSEKRAGDVRKQYHCPCEEVQVYRVVR